MLSELQISLIGAGLGAVAGVWGYNTWQAYRQRRDGERILSVPQEDILMQEEASAKLPATQSDDAAQARIEPVLTESAETQIAIEPDDSEPPAELADDFVDCIVRLEAAEMIAAPLLWAAQRKALGTLGALGDRVRWSGLDENGGEWRQLGAHDGTSYRHLRVAMQIADRNGPIGEAELSGFYNAIRQLADDFQAAAEFPAISVVLAHARSLDEFCASVDWRIGMNVVNLDGRTISAAKLIDLATEASLWLKDDGMFHAEDAAGQTIFTLSDLGGKPFAAGLGTLTLNGVALSIDVPLVSDGREAFDRLLETAQRLMGLFDGTLVDDRRTPLTAEMLATIRTKIGEFQDQMSERQLPAGGRRALRLYS